LLIETKKSLPNISTNVEQELNTKNSTTSHGCIGAPDDFLVGALAAWARLRPLLVLSYFLVQYLLNSSGQHSVDGLSGAEGLVHLNQLADAVDDQLYELTLRLAKTGKIGDVVGGVLSQG